MEKFNIFICFCALVLLVSLLGCGEESKIDSTSVVRPEPNSEDTDNKQDDFNRLVNDEDVIIYAENGLFSAKCYSEFLGEYSGAEFDSSITLFLADDCKSDELQFDKVRNSYTIEVITVIHYNEYDNEYDDYNVMFNGAVVSNGMFNIRTLKDGE